MPFLASVAFALTAPACAAGSDNPFATYCLASVSDSDLAGSVGGTDLGTMSLLTSLAALQGRDQMRLTGSAAGLQMDAWLSEKEMEALTEAAHPMKKAPLLDPQNPIASALLNGFPTLIVNESTVPWTGTATVTTDIRMGTITMDGLQLN